MTILRRISGKAINGPKYKVEMPPFADKLTNRQIADIINRERTSWGTHGPLSDACRHCENRRQETGATMTDTMTDWALSARGYLCTAPATANGAGDYRLAGPILGAVLVVSRAWLVTLSCIGAALPRMVKLAGATLPLLAQH
ncbi:hypothetical protein [Bradyrhizobium sp.]|uniref:hypothetical protein n=1 Tax=Bradyrhizobium sp. TaxID=376 RepID=UPI0007C979F5|nr:hypothetical protein [Bradyrhizobium sp.]